MDGATSEEYINNSTSTSTYTWVGTNESQILVSDDGTLLAQAILYYSIGGFALFGNMAVVVVIFQYTQMRQNLTNVYVINQSMIDGTAGLILIFTKAFRYHFDRPLFGLSGEVFCRIWVSHVPLWSILISSTYNLVALTLERYLGVVYPIMHRVSFTRPKVVISLVCIWLSGLVLQLSYKVPTGGLSPDGTCLILSSWPSPILKRVVGGSLFFIEFFLPLGLIAFCYVKMFKLMNGKVAPANDGSRTAVAVNTGSGNATKERLSQRNMKARRNILKTLIIVSVCFTFCWIWNETYYFLTNIGLVTLDFRSPFDFFSTVCIYLNCCINPVIYIIHYEQFKKGLRLLKSRLLKSNVSVAAENRSSQQ